MTTMIAALFLFTGITTATELPQELKSLESLLDNEQSLVDAVRRFDLQQKQLINWDIEEAAKHRDGGASELSSIGTLRKLRSIEMAVLANSPQLGH